MGVNWEEYRDQRLWHEGSGVFHANLYPLGKARLTESHSEELLKFFGFNKFQDYENYVRDKRFRKMFEFWMKHKPQATVCFGVGHRKDFERLFSPLECRFMETSACYLDLENKILLMRHLSRGVSSELESQVVKILENWKVILTA